ncbi:jg20929, partial [Pararge aegeria aegeria]
MLGLHRGECFGLLGVNGAGKSSTFKMLTGVECTTRGAIFANGNFMSRTSGKYLQSLGYCPQFFGLDEFLSGHDNLTLLLTLRGLAPDDVEAEAKTWIEIV